MLDKFLELLKESVILQGLLTLSIWGTLIALTLLDKPVPDVLTSAANLVLGFYFGSKIAIAQRLAYRDIEKLRRTK